MGFAQGLDCLRRGFNPPADLCYSSLGCAHTSCSARMLLGQPQAAGGGGQPAPSSAALYLMLTFAKGN